MKCACRRVAPHIIVMVTVVLSFSLYDARVCVDCFTVMVNITVIQLPIAMRYIHSRFYLGGVCWHKNNGNFKIINSITFHTREKILALLFLHFHLASVVLSTMTIYISAIGKLSPRTRFSVFIIDRWLASKLVGKRNIQFVLFCSFSLFVLLLVEIAQDIIEIIYLPLLDYLQYSCVNINADLWDPISD